MSQKSERPTLPGQRFRTRKRDDPVGFRDTIYPSGSMGGGSGPSGSLSGVGGVGNSNSSSSSSSYQVHHHHHHHHHHQRQQQLEQQQQQHQHQHPSHYHHNQHHHPRNSSSHFHHHGPPPPPPPPRPSMQSHHHHKSQLPSDRSRERSMSGHGSCLSNSSSITQQPLPLSGSLSPSHQSVLSKLERKKRLLACVVPTPSGAQVSRLTLPTSSPLNNNNNSTFNNNSTTASSMSSASHSHNGITSETLVYNNSSSAKYSSHNHQYQDHLSGSSQSANSLHHSHHQHHHHHHHQPPITNHHHHDRLASSPAPTSQYKSSSVTPVVTNTHHHPHHHTSHHLKSSSSTLNSPIIASSGNNNNTTNNSSKSSIISNDLRRLSTSSQSKSSLIPTPINSIQHQQSTPTQMTVVSNLTQSTTAADKSKQKSSSSSSSSSLLPNSIYNKAGPGQKSSTLTTYSTNQLLTKSGDYSKMIDIDSQTINLDIIDPRKSKILVQRTTVMTPNGGDDLVAAAFTKIHSSFEDNSNYIDSIKVTSSELAQRRIKKKESTASLADSTTHRIDDQSSSEVSSTSDADSAKLINNTKLSSSNSAITSNKAVMNLPLPKFACITALTTAETTTTTTTTTFSAIEKLTPDRELTTVSSSNKLLLNKTPLSSLSTNNRHPLSSPATLSSFSSTQRSDSITPMVDYSKFNIRKKSTPSPSVTLLDHNNSNPHPLSNSNLVNHHQQKQQQEQNQPMNNIEPCVVTGPTSASISSDEEKVSLNTIESEPNNPMIDDQSCDHDPSSLNRRAEIVDYPDIKSEQHDAELNLDLNHIPRTPETHEGSEIHETKAKIESDTGITLGWSSVERFAEEHKSSSANSSNSSNSSSSSSSSSYSTNNKRGTKNRVKSKTSAKSRDKSKQRNSEFFLSDDEPIYMSMYDKVKARSSAIKQQQPPQPLASTSTTDMPSKHEAPASISNSKRGPSNFNIRKKKDRNQSKKYKSRSHIDEDNSNSETNSDDDEDDNDVDSDNSLTPPVHNHDIHDGDDEGGEEEEEENIVVLRLTSPSPSPPPVKREQKQRKRHSQHELKSKNKSKLKLKNNKGKDLKNEKVRNLKSKKIKSNIAINKKKPAKTTRRFTMKDFELPPKAERQEKQLSQHQHPKPRSPSPSSSSSSLSDSSSSSASRSSSSSDSSESSNTPECQSASDDEELFATVAEATKSMMNVTEAANSPQLSPPPSPIAIDHSLMINTEGESPMNIDKTPDVNNSLNQHMHNVDSHIQQATSNSCANPSWSSMISQPLFINLPTANSTIQPQPSSHHSSHHGGGGSGSNLASPRKSANSELVIIPSPVLQCVKPATPECSPVAKIPIMSNELPTLDSRCETEQAISTLLMEMDTEEVNKPSLPIISPSATGPTQQRCHRTSTSTSNTQSPANSSKSQAFDVFEFRDSDEEEGTTKIATTQSPSITSTRTSSTPPIIDLNQSTIVVAVSSQLNTIGVVDSPAVPTEQNIAVVAPKYQSPDANGSKQSPVSDSVTSLRDQSKTVDNLSNEGRTSSPGIMLANDVPQSSPRPNNQSLTPKISVENNETATHISMLSESQHNEKSHQIPLTTVLNLCAPDSDNVSGRQESVNLGDLLQIVPDLNQNEQQNHEIALDTLSIKVESCQPNQSPVMMDIDSAPQQKDREYITELNQDGKLSLTIRKASNQARDPSDLRTQAKPVPSDNAQLSDCTNVTNAIISTTTSESSIASTATTLVASNILVPTMSIQSKASATLNQQYVNPGPDMPMTTTSLPTSIESQTVTQSEVKQTHPTITTVAASTSSTSATTAQNSIKPTRRSARLMQSATKEKKEPASNLDIDQTSNSGSTGTQNSSNSNSSQNETPQSQSSLPVGSVNPVLTENLPPNLSTITRDGGTGVFASAGATVPVALASINSSEALKESQPSVISSAPDQSLTADQPIQPPPTKTRRNARNKIAKQQQLSTHQEASFNASSLTKSAPTNQQPQQIGPKADMRPAGPSTNVGPTPAKRRPKRLTRLAAKTYGIEENFQETNNQQVDNSNQPQQPTQQQPQPPTQLNQEQQQQPLTQVTRDQIHTYNQRQPNQAECVNLSGANTGNTNTIATVVNQTSNVKTMNDENTSVPLQSSLVSSSSATTGSSGSVVMSVGTPPLREPTPIGASRTSVLQEPDKSATLVPSYLPPRKRLGWFWSQKQLLEQRYLVVWTSRFMLKDSFAAVQMHFISGNNKMPSWSYRAMLDENGVPSPIHINQRMRLEPLELEGVQNKMLNEDDHCVLLAVPVGRDQSEYLKHSTSLRVGFIDYLTSKQAAGIVYVCQPGEMQPSYIIHIFPSCTFVTDHILRSEPSLLSVIQNIDNLIVVITTA